MPKTVDEYDLTNQNSTSSQLLDKLGTSEEFKQAKTPANQSEFGEPHMDALEPTELQVNEHPEDIQNHETESASMFEAHKQDEFGEPQADLLSTTEQQVNPEVVTPYEMESAAMLELKNGVIREFVTQLQSTTNEFADILGYYADVFFEKANQTNNIFLAQIASTLRDNALQLHRIPNNENIESWQMNQGSPEEQSVVSELEDLIQQVKSITEQIMNVTNNTNSISTVLQGRIGGLQSEASQEISSNQDSQCVNIQGDSSEEIEIRQNLQDLNDQTEMVFNQLQEDLSEVALSQFQAESSEQPEMAFSQFQEDPREKPNANFNQFQERSRDKKNTTVAIDQFHEDSNLQAETEDNEFQKIVKVSAENEEVADEVQSMNEQQESPLDDVQEAVKNDEAEEIFESEDESLSQFDDEEIDSP